jgi:lipoate-protein ligase A
MTKKLFASLDVYHDIDSRPAALNMAVDEALLETATGSVIRFYQWDHPALSFGYFGRFDEVAGHETERELVRRWTGGGIVLHGKDLTYSIVIPADDIAFGESTMSIYEETHAAIRAALAKSGKNARLAESAGPKISESCFANAVRADVLWNGQKVAGAAQRRTRRGLLQQGSIQNVDLAPDFGKSFASELSDRWSEKTFEARVLERAEEIAAQKYAAAAWLRRR